MLPPMKPAATPKTDTNRPQPPHSMRELVTLSLLLAPRGGVPVHRHGQGMSGGSPASSVKP
jgi:hypothetical protein